MRGGRRFIAAIMETKASYLIESVQGNVIEDQEGKIRLTPSSIKISSPLSPPLEISYEDITSIVSRDYKIRIKLFSDDVIVIGDLGYKYEDALRELIKSRNEFILKNMLISNSLVKSGYKADISVEREDGRIDYSDCEIRIYENALIVFTKTSDPLSLLFCFMEDIRKERYEVKIIMDDKKVTLRNLGKKFDSFTRVLSETNDKMAFRTQTTLSTLLPKASPLELRRLANSMKDGKAVSRMETEEISDALWEQLKNRLDLIHIKKEYDFLSAYANKDKIHFGVKRGLMGDMTGDYLWFLFPLYAADTSIPVNAIAMETVNTEGESQASYFFKICDRRKYKETDSINELSSLVDERLKEINRCMLEIDFRREPIYLKEERLQEEKYEKYRIAMSLVPEIKKIRDAYIGRVIHRSFRQWSEDVVSLLTFNINATDETSIWNKN